MNNLTFFSIFTVIFFLIKYDFLSILSKLALCDQGRHFIQNICGCPFGFNMLN